MRFSLVLSSVGRLDVMRRFLRSLQEQSHRQFHLALVDQSPDGCLERIVREWRQRISIQYLQSSRGLSKGRNAALRHIDGDVVAFPDDDCWYPPDLLQRVAHVLREKPRVSGVTGRSVDEDGRPSMGRWGERETMLTRFNVWTRGVSFTMFLKHEVVARVGGFEEGLGAGAWGAGEETDYLLRAIANGFHLIYSPGVVVNHPQSVQASGTPSAQEAYRHGLGWGFLLKRHRFPPWFACYQCLRPLAGCAFSAVRGRPRRCAHHWAVFRGRLDGWLRSRSSDTRISAASR